MSQPAAAPRRTPLYDAHARLGGKIIEFGGWSLPVQYTSILEEHHAVRSAAGVFDVSHLGRVVVSGGGALDFLQRVSTNDVARVEVGQAQYGLLLRPDGGVLDDIFVYRLPDHYLVVVNAATTDKDLAWLRQHAAGRRDLTLEDITAETATISVQGPDALEALQPLANVDLAAMKRHAVQPARFAGRAMLVARTGYTGERGVEIFPRAEDVAAAWDALLSTSLPIKPCGLGARDTLRLEAGNRLYGHDVDETINPVEAGLEWAVRLDKGEFVGRNAVAHALSRGVSRRLVGFESSERAVAREGSSVVRHGGAVGRVTSGTYSPSLQRPIGFAYVPPDLAAVGSDLSLDVRGRPVAARVVPTPFYKRPRPAREGAGRHAPQE